MFKYTEIPIEKLNQEGFNNAIDEEQEEIVDEYLLTM